MADEDVLARMQDAAALWSAGQATAAEVIDAACDLLVAGFDGPVLAVLAGLRARDADREVPYLLEGALAEVGLTHYPRDSRPGREAVLRIMASRVLAGSLAPRSLTVWAHSAIGHDRSALADRLVELDDVYDILEYSAMTGPEVDDAVRAEARRIAGDNSRPGRAGT